jgi:hypothetical protein
MAFALNFSTCSTKSCDNLQFTDTSIDWASASIAIGDSVYVAITITDSSSVSETYDVSAVFDAATVQSDLIYNSEDYNGGPFPDGRYTITYEIYDALGGTLLYSKTIEVYIYCNLQCCMQTTAAKLKDYVDCNNCDTDYVNNYFKMKGIYEGFRGQVAFGLFTDAQTTYDILHEMCDFKNCNCN